MGMGTGEGGGGGDDKPAIADKGAGQYSQGSFNPLTGKYTANECDTINDIAKRFSLTVDDLIKSNPALESGSITTGQKISIPEFRMPQADKNVGDNKYNYQQYIKIWENLHPGQQMTEKQKANLATGCIGIVSVNTNSNPEKFENMVAFSSFEKALRTGWELNQKGLNVEFVMFSMRFYSGDEPGAANKYKPDSNGVVNMQGYAQRTDKGAPWEGFGRAIPFDFGFYTPETGKWWHADRSESKNQKMTIFESTLKSFSRQMDFFDQQIFVICPVLKQ